MTRKINSQPIPPLDELKQSFSEWRKHRKHRTRIPEPLWDGAVQLSQRYSVGFISKTLRLSYTDLKKRFQTTPSNRSLPCLPKSPFVELSLDSPLAPSVSIIEMESPGGLRMRIQTHGDVSSLLLELGQSLRRKER